MYTLDMLRNETSVQAPDTAVPARKHNFVLVGGKWLTSKYLEPLEEELVSRGHTATTVDLDMHAQNPASTTLKEGLEVVRQVKHMEDMTLVGHSAGFQASLWASNLLDSERVNSLIGIASAGPYGYSPPRLDEKEFTPRRQTDLFRRGMRTEKIDGKLMSVLAPWVIKDCLMHDVEPEQVEFIEIRSHRPDKTREKTRLWRLGLPVLFINALDDRVTNLDTARRTQAYLKAESHDIEGGHMVVLTRYQAIASLAISHADKAASTHSRF